MEDFQHIKKISLEQAKKIPPENIAYLTLKNGEIIVVNGLNYEIFEEKQKEYNNYINYIEEQNKNNLGNNFNNNFNNNLYLIQEDTEENERNSKLYNQQNNPSYNHYNNIQKNPKYIYNIKRNNNDKHNNYNNLSYTEIISTSKNKK